MRFIVLVLFVFFSLCADSQDLKKLEDDMRNTYINDYKKMRQKADKIYQLEPFNELATYYLSTSFHEAKLQDSIDLLFASLKATDPKNPKPYLLAAKYQYRHVMPNDTSAIKDLLKVIELDSNNIDAYMFLGAMYYGRFIEKPSRYFANESRKYLLKAIENGKHMLTMFKYPIVQLSSYLKDSTTLNHYKNLKPGLSVDSLNRPAPGNWYYPLSKFLILPQSWESDSSFNILEEINRHTFTLSWYTEQLTALHEPLIYNQIGNTIYRFTWLRTFHKPISIRIEKNEGDYVVFWRMADGAGGYEPGNLVVQKSRKMSPGEWLEFKSLVDSTDFWNLPVKIKLMGTDGAQWLIEGMDDGKYHIVERWSPRNNNYEKLGKYMIGLTDLEIKKSELY